MGPWKKMLVHVAWSGLFVSGFPGAILPLAAQQATREPSAESSQTSVAKVEQPNLAELPDSPGAVASKSAEISQQSGSPAPASTSLASQSQSPQTGVTTQTQPPAPYQSQPASQTQPQRPVGTAAAEAPNATGIAASQPAGVAVAPAKQRRARTIVLRMGAIIGAGVAVGSVVALTAGTSSKPPGAR
jgi:cytoskeletal protein RodZ